MPAAEWTAKHPSRKAAKSDGHQPVALMLQGGGALGAYQVGSYEAMVEAGMQPDWVSGISIGAMNAAIIAGNPPEKRLEKLKGFWNEIAVPIPLFSSKESVLHKIKTSGVHGYFEPAENSATYHMLDSMGAKQFSAEPVSLYDPKQMYKTLAKFVDFDYLNAPNNPTRLSVGTTDALSSKLVYFDNKIDLPEDKASRIKNYGIMRSRLEIRKVPFEPKHIMASGALLPSFPTVEIDGRSYIDGGHKSNTPVRFAHETGQLKKDMLVIRPDLWNPTSEEDPKTYDKKLERALEVQLASPIIDLSGIVAGHIHTVCERQTRQTSNKFFDFTADSIQKNWQAGYNDMKAAIEEYRQKQTGRKNGTITAGNGGDALFLNGNHGHQR